MSALVSLHLAGRLSAGRSVTQLAALDHDLHGARPARLRSGSASGRGTRTGAAKGRKR